MKSISAEHGMRFIERTLASVRTECMCGWKAETSGAARQEALNKQVAAHLGARLMASAADA